MTPLENKLRQAVRAKAGEVPPGAVPPLRLPARPLADRRRWGWAVPIAAAAAVAAVIAVSFAIASVIYQGRPAARPSGPFAALPRYYVTLTFTGDGQCCGRGGLYAPKTEAVVRATATGRALATITPPRPYGTFVGVTAAADDRTFVLAAQELAHLPLVNPPATKFFLLRLTPGSHASDGIARLTALPIPVLPAGTQLTDLALSPNGALLAAEISPTGRIDEPGLHVFNVSTGAERTWSPAGIGTSRAVGATQGSLSWTSDSRVLAFIYWGAPGGGGIRLLNTAAPGSNLLASIRLAVRQPTNASGEAYWIQARVTPDGHAIIAIRDRHGAGFSQQLVVFSARTGKVLRILSDLKFLSADDEQVQWTSPSGNVLIVTDAGRSNSTRHAPFSEADAGVMRGRHYTPLPWPARTFASAW